MRVAGTQPPDDSSDEQRVSRRRALVWALVGVAVLVGVYLYFRYERAFAPLVAS